MNIYLNKEFRDIKMKLLVVFICALLRFSYSILAEDEFTQDRGILTIDEIFSDPSTNYKHANRNGEVIIKKNITSSCGKKPYFLLNGLWGNLIIIDGTSYDQIINYYYNDYQLTFNILAIVDDTLYNINPREGTIHSTAIANVIEGSIVWAHIGSFPKEESYIIRNSAVADGPLLYFVTAYGKFYLYDTILRTVTKLGSVKPYDSYAFLVVVNKIVYIHKYIYFYSFDGKTIKEITTSDTRINPGLFRMGNKVCRVGGNTTNVYPDPVNCYNPDDGTWSTANYINEHRRQLGVAGTDSKTYIVGGWAVDVSGNYSLSNYRDSIEVLDHESNTWSYVPTPLTGDPDNMNLMTALLFYY